jgi:hypothetical protein
VASKQHYDVALRCGDLTHSALSLAAGSEADARRIALNDASETSGGDVEFWKVISCEPVPAPMLRRAA